MMIDMKCEFINEMIRMQRRGLSIMVSSIPLFNVFAAWRTTNLYHLTQIRELSGFCPLLQSCINRAQVPVIKGQLNIFGSEKTERC